MRYPRNVKIFRGQVDAGPFASFFFLVVIFLLLFQSHVFIPGVRVELQQREPPPPIPDRSLLIQRKGTIILGGQEYTFVELQAELRERHKTGTLPRQFVLEAEPGVRNEQIEPIENLLAGLGIGRKVPGGRLELPESAGFPGTAGEQVVVGVNLNGQIFYHHQLISEQALQQELTVAVERTLGPLTMVLQLDKNVPAGKFMKLCEIARKSGVENVVFAHRPPPLN